MAGLDRVRRVRISKDMDERLKRDAKALGMSESEAIRMGLAIVHDRAHRRQERQRLLDLCYVPRDGSERARFR